MLMQKKKVRLVSRLMTALLSVALVFTMMPLAAGFAFAEDAAADPVIKGNVLKKEMTLNETTLKSILNEKDVKYSGYNKYGSEKNAMAKKSVFFSDLISFVGLKDGAKVEKIIVTTNKIKDGSSTIEDTPYVASWLLDTPDPSINTFGEGDTQVINGKAVLAFAWNDGKGDKTGTRVLVGAFNGMALDTEGSGKLIANSKYWIDTITKIEVVGTVPPVVDGQEATVDGNSYAVTSASAKTAAFTKGKNGKKQSVPSTVTVNGVQLRVTEVAPNAFTGTTARTVTLGQNIEKLDAKAFAKSKVTKLVVKTKKLTKASVKGSLKSSKVKKIQVKVGSKKVNKKYVKKYKKFFTKKNAGKKARVYR